MNVSIFKLKYEIVYRIILHPQLQVLYLPQHGCRLTYSQTEVIVKLQRFALRSMQRFLTCTHPPNILSSLEFTYMCTASSHQCKFSAAP